MAIDTENKRRSAIRWHPNLNIFPVPDGAISVFDRRHAAGRYRGLPVPVSLGGTLNLNRSTLMDGLMGWWPLSEANYQGGVFVDGSGEGNDGTPANAPNFAINGFRNPVGSTVFNGSSDLVNCGNDASLQFSTGLSISAWIRTSADGCIGQRLHDAVDEGILLFRVIAGKIQFLVSNNSLGNISAVNSTAPVNDNAWHHVVGTTDRTTMRTYIDGGADGTANDTSSDTLGSSVEDLSIGVRLPTTAWFDGDITDVRIYNRVLTPAEIKLLYTPSLAMALELDRSYGGGLTPAGALGRALTAYRSFGGGLTPSGSMITVLTIVQALGGTLGLSGAIAVANPLWLLIDNTLTWQGEWNVARSYNLNDAVLYKASSGNEWHVFVSKITHNVGNTPTSSADAWRRYYQELWL